MTKLIKSGKNKIVQLIQQQKGKYRDEELARITLEKNCARAVEGNICLERDYMACTLYDEVKTRCNNESMHSRFARTRRLPTIRIQEKHGKFFK